MKEIRSTKQAIKKLAFGSVTDAVRLLIKNGDVSEEELENMDLYCIAGIKSTGGKISEIKFCDRLKAIGLLLSLDESEKGKGTNFADALRMGAENLD